MFRRAILSMLLLFSSTAWGVRAADVEWEDLKPGLLAVYKAGDVTLKRLDVKPAFTLHEGSIHPRLPPGVFTVEWQGILFLKDPGPITFDAFVCGELTMDVDGLRVLDGRGEHLTSQVKAKQSLQRDRGLYRLHIRYRSLAGLPARLQIGWQAPSYGREPLPAWQLKHVKVEGVPAFDEEINVRPGRELAEQFGCARCHATAFPGLAGISPGPDLSDIGRRTRLDWLREFMSAPLPTDMTHHHNPDCFSKDRIGFVESQLVAEHLAESSATPEPKSSAGDHRMGRRQFISLGCFTCHPLRERIQERELEGSRRRDLTSISEYLPALSLAQFLQNTHSRYPDGRCPQMSLSPETARDIAAYLLLESDTAKRTVTFVPPTEAEIQAVLKKLRVRDRKSAGPALLRERGCSRCHSGISSAPVEDVPIHPKRAHQECSGMHFRFPEIRKWGGPLRAWMEVAATEKYPSPYYQRQRALDRAACMKCHQHDTDQAPPIESYASQLGSAWLQVIPYQRTPRLNGALEKYTYRHLVSAVRDGVSGLRSSRYTYRMPAYGAQAEMLVQALAERDGELITSEPERPAVDPQLGTVEGPQLAGFQGYSCVSCHLWNGQSLADPDPGSVGPDLTRVAGRIRRDWFDRFLDAPARAHPGTPMPSIFFKDRPATLGNVLGGDPARQKDALWAYFALGTKAPSPKPPPPLTVAVPSDGGLVAQIPLHLPDRRVVESICLLTANNDLVIYDVGELRLHSVYTGARLLRQVQGRLRTYNVTGTRVDLKLPERPPASLRFLGYDRLPDGVRIRMQGESTEQTETVRLTMKDGQRRLEAGASWQTVLPPPAPLPPLDQAVAFDPTPPPEKLERPGYRAIAYPRLRAANGMDLLMPGALAADPKTGRLFIASMKGGEIFALDDPTDDGKRARYVDYTGGLFQEAYSLLAEDGALYALHRRNLTKIVDTDGDGRADRFERVAGLPHGSADTYDYGYGLVRDRSGAFVYSYAPYANRRIAGSGGAVRLVDGKPQELAYGFRNPVGWCTGPDGEIFCTDNQGEWVATNKLCHVETGRYYGFPNPEQAEHAKKPRGATALWIPYDWAQSINGVTYDNTGGKFGPFAGQFFLAELMFGGAIVRANLEKINGVYQGACFPFYGRGLLGPLALTFDPKGRLWVGSITEPGWMAQPDRGALYRLDYVGPTPFEIQSIHVQPQGFRLVFTKPVQPSTLTAHLSIKVEHYRYEYTSAYGSPELDRTRVSIEKATLSLDGRSVEVTVPLVKDRVYRINASGLRSTDGETLVHPEGAYTLNEIPAK